MITGFPLLPSHVGKTIASGRLHAVKAWHSRLIEALLINGISPKAKRYPLQGWAALTPALIEVERPSAYCRFFTRRTGYGTNKALMLELWWPVTTNISAKDDATNVLTTDAKMVVPCQGNKSLFFWPMRVERPAARTIPHKGKGATFNGCVWWPLLRP